MSNRPQSEKMIVSEADVTSRCRAVSKPGIYMIFPRANRVVHHLPNFNGVEVQVLATPRQGARFVEHELLVAPGGGTSKPRDEEFEQFFYIQEGEIVLRVEGGKAHKKPRDAFCWLPPHLPHQFSNKSKKLARLIYIRRRYEEMPGTPVPGSLLSHEQDVPAYPVND